MPLQIRAASFFCLISPALFHFLMLIFLRYMLLHIEITVYLNYLVDLIKETAETDASEDDKDLIQRSLMWHKGAGFISPLKRYPRSYWLVPASPLLLPLFGVFLLFFVFVFINTVGFSDWDGLSGVRVIEWALLLLNVLVSCHLIWLAKCIGSRDQANTMADSEEMLKLELPL